MSRDLILTNKEKIEVNLKRLNMSKNELWVKLGISKPTGISKLRKNYWKDSEIEHLKKLGLI